MIESAERGGLISFGKWRESISNFHERPSFISWTRRRPFPIRLLQLLLVAGCSRSRSFRRPHACLQWPMPLNQLFTPVQLPVMAVPSIGPCTLRWTVSQPAISPCCWILRFITPSMLQTQPRNCLPAHQRQGLPTPLTLGLPLVEALLAFQEQPMS